MGKALAVQSARSGSAALAGAFGGARAYHSRVNRAKLHTSSPKEAQTIELENMRAKQGTIRLSVAFMATLRHGRHAIECGHRMGI
jgi:hypothetical protein